LQNRYSLIPSLQAKLYVADVEHVMTNLTRSDRAMDGISDTETDNVGGRLEIELKAFSLDRFFVGSELYRLNMNGIRKRDGRPGTMMAGKHFEDVIWPQARNDHFGFFTEMIKSLNSRFLLSAGARYDSDSYRGGHFDQSFLALYPGSNTKVNFSNLSFHFGTEYLLSNNNSFTLKLGQGLRSPSVKELYINRFNIGRDGYEYLGNPNLKPEQNRQVDLAFLSSREKYDLSATIFYSSMKNYISAKYDPTLPKVMKSVPGVKRIVNINDAFRAGGEMRFEYFYSSTLSINNSIAYTYAQNVTDNEPLMEIPPLEYKMSARYNFSEDKNYVRLEGRFVADQTRISRAFAETKTSGFNVWNISAGYKITNKIGLIAGIDNIFNQYYYEHLNRSLKYTGMAGQHLYEPGRNIYLYLKFGF